ncbi:flagellar hook assembly protein FlgD [Bacillus chungangensis]|uniref:Basal-body rod modification protein FlgD n=1 Tax=Bacillus chungangensis TaxID=587633 RepID=A0ABT9WRP3_9BACI|nr:flagellar hook assembly protein FlgD [Bacillus chungangensis]MDQ0175818.1 flagellar basal-body rod modification protein FlgD [Bacillus chungangensis]
MFTTIDPDLIFSPVQRVPKGDNLGKDDFMKILMAQLANQDPLNPMEDRDFIAQLAQFSTLEQMMNMARSFEKLAQTQEQSTLMAYNQFIGKQVAWHKIVEEEGKAPVILDGTGVVQMVQFKGDSVELVLKDGTILQPGNISDVKSGTIDSPLIQASYLINKEVTWIEDDESKDPQEKNGIVTSVAIKDGTTWLYFSDNEKVSADKIIKVGS